MATKALAFAGEAAVVPQDRTGFVRHIQDALRIRNFEVAPADAFAAWSAYSATAGWAWVRVPEDTYEVLMRIRPFLGATPTVAR
ncbi:hypothetical protein LAZ40_17515 [Cereibacter sphaeroides]|uniref:hypothetical protein n=1 Tax=Rhodobacterales TaxID=204455 RepID=UPI000BBE7AD8|nr:MULTISPECIES: hypothetical protein [Paracoccaceae]MCE6951502.1 hypothetical protein [Cereibacter sphaeroides]MCE6960827.1 hypothetical protein [Cereibacter sphaeroides]MCE6969907.1 hypothetical protein [Cereibacter sphaeroides]MCE6974295.1 hypothetical protein [Cereibacter sphaeroides]